MGKNLIEEMNKRGIKKNIRLHDGTCYVHEEYNPKMIESLREKYPGLMVLSHPECSPQVAGKADYVGSTSQMLEQVKKTDNETYLMLTECGLIGRLEVEYPNKKFVGTCTQCRYMKSNTLIDIKRVLSEPSSFDRIEINEDVRLRAKKSIDQMFAYVEAFTVAN